MKKWTIPLVGAAALALALVSQVAWAGDGGGLHGRLGRMLHGTGLSGEGIAAHLEALAERLELSTAQRKEVAAVLAGTLSELEARALEVAAAHAAQIERVHSKVIDEAEIRAASARAGAAQAELAVVAARLLRDVHALLTPEQLARLEEFHPTDAGERLSAHVRGFKRGAQEWAVRQ